MTPGRPVLVQRGIWSHPTCPVPPLRKKVYPGQADDEWRIVGLDRCLPSQQSGLWPPGAGCQPQAHSIPSCFCSEVPMAVAGQCPGPGPGHGASSSAKQAA